MKIHIIPTMGYIMQYTVDLWYSFQNVFKIFLIRFYDFYILLQDLYCFKMSMSLYRYPAIFEYVIFGWAWKNHATGLLSLRLHIFNAIIQDTVKRINYFWPTNSHPFPSVARFEQIFGIICKLLLFFRKMFFCNINLWTKSTIIQI